MIRIWLCACCSDDAELALRAYDLRMDLSNGSLQFTAKDDAGNPVSASEPSSLGLIGLQTHESMAGHWATLTFMAAHPFGNLLRKRILPQDMLLVQALTPLGWDTLFDGFVSSIRWSEEGGGSSYHHKFHVSFEGAHRLLNQGWENWQGVLRVNESKGIGKAGVALMEKLDKEKLYDLPERMVELLLTEGLDKLLDIRARGTQIGSGWFKLGTGDDWKTDFNFTVYAQKAWYLRTQGQLSGIIHGLIEPEVHEFFLTYEGGAPTWIFRPHPFPGPVGDDARWTRLAQQAVQLGVPGAPGCVGGNGSRSDARRANAFHWAGSSGSTWNGNELLGKLRIGFWASESHIRKYGYCARQVTTSLVGMGSGPQENWLLTLAPKLVERVAWQDFPLPWLEQQSRHYPWLPSRVAGVHIGKVITDQSGRAPMTGYLVSVQHSIQASPAGFQAHTVLGVERACEGATPSDYPDKVRAFATGLEQIPYAPTGSGRMAELLESASGNEPVVQTSASKLSYILPADGPIGDRVGVRTHPVTGLVCSHKGTDIKAPAGSSVVAPAYVQIARVWTSETGGNCVSMTDSQGYVHTMMHLSEPCTLAVRAVVPAGGFLGKVGSTGTYATGAHLHWEVTSPSGAVFNPFPK